MTEVVDESLETASSSGVSRRNVLRAGAVGAAAVGLGAGKVLMAPTLNMRGLSTPDGVFGATSIALADALYIEAFPTSPLILNPFTDSLLIPPAATPLTPAEVAALPLPPGPGVGQQNSFRNETHQLWPDAIGFPDPIVYKFDLLVRTHSFTTSQVLPINSLGQPVKSFDAAGNTFPAGTVRTLPPSTIYGFNGTFPGPRINAEYGKPVPRPVREPPGREPAEPGPAGLRLAGLLVPDPPAQRAHRARSRTASRTTRSCSARRPRATRSSPSWTTST